MDMEHEIKGAPSAQQAAGSIDTLEFSSLLGELHAGYQYGPTSRYDAAHAALIEHITEWAGRPAATPAQPIAPQEPMTTDEAREFLIGFMNEHFTDRTFHRYIRADQVDKSRLAGDFAWQMATALRKIGASPCAMCNGAGSVGHAPDGYSDCPECTAPVAQPIADMSAPTDERAAFEMWARRTHTRPGTHFDRSHNGVYKDNRIAAKWAAWQAARAAAPVSGATIKSFAAQQNAELVLARLEQMHKDSVPGSRRDQIEEAMPCALAVVRHLSGNPAAPVSGQGASVDDDDFGVKLSLWFRAAQDEDNPAEAKKRRAILVRHIHAWADSRPRSEDSRAMKVLEAMNHMGGDERGGYCICPLNDGSAPDHKHATICADARRALASTTPQKADNE